MEGARSAGFSWVLAAVTALLLAPGVESHAAPPDGKELFLREWIPNDPRSHGGDGLGPVFNDTSCVTCHNQGGTGGGGAGAKNVDLITAFSADTNRPAEHSVIGFLFRSVLSGNAAENLKRKEKGADESPGEEQKREAERQREKLAQIHPGFRTARSLILHKSGTSPEYAQWRNQLTGVARFGPHFTTSVFVGGSFAGDELRTSSDANQAEINTLQAEGQFGGRFGFFPQAAQDGFAFIPSQRNPTALFGAGRIDSIPDDAILAGAAKEHAGFPEVKGRAAKLKDGRLGRFGWKAQKARLEEFVSTACAVELGLHVPGEPQSGVPQDPAYRAPGLDLDRDEVSALTAYIAELRAPVERQPANATEGAALASGKNLFAEVGCASCHVPRLGEVEGIHSDLLLHNMGQELADTGAYGSFAPDRTEDEEIAGPLPSLQQSFVIGGQRGEEEKKNLTGATRHEWRTPPLWGVRESAPYLHDGRAATLEQAIAFHGGEGDRSRRKYFALAHDQRLQLQAFLKSLVAPN